MADYSMIPVTRESLIADIRRAKAGALRQRDAKTVLECTDTLRRLGDESFTEQEAAEITLIAELDAVDTALYRAFDHDGRLLYAGISLKFLARLMQHRARSKWFKPELQRVELQWYGSRSAAAAAERHAIETENPLHNITYNKAHNNAAKERKARAICTAASKRLKR